MKTLIVIVGPTAVGKTEAAIRLAERVGGEIVSADSRQVYRHMDIGTAKPSARLRIPAVPPNPELRAELEPRAAQEGKLALHDELRRVDPAAAARIDPRNVRRTIRALEVYRLSGRRFSEPGIVRPPPYPIITIGLTMPRPHLYRLIDARVGEMIAAGLIEETRQLALQYDWSLPALSGLGYRQIGRFVRGECSLEDAIAAIKRDTRGFVRRQYNWFRLTDPRIRWLDARLEIDRDLLTIVRPERAAVK